MTTQTQRPLMAYANPAASGCSGCSACDHGQMPAGMVHALLSDPFDVGIHVLDQTDALLDWLRAALGAERTWVVEPYTAACWLPNGSGSLDHGEWRAVTDEAGIEWFHIRVRSGDRDLLLGARRSKRGVDGLDACADQVAALATARLVRFAAWSDGVEAERAAAEIDPLTGLGNRAAADALMASLKIGEALAVFDLDDFKQTNDLSGHAVGDEVLRSFAAVLTGRTRHGDTVARLGGDEFVLVVRNGIEASGVVARIVTDWQHGGLGTVSAGTAIRSAGEMPVDVYARADQNLYAVKRSRIR